MRCLTVFKQSKSYKVSSPIHGRKKANTQPPTEPIPEPKIRLKPPAPQIPTPAPPDLPSPPSKQNGTSSTLVDKIITTTNSAPPPLQKKRQGVDSGIITLDDVKIQSYEKPERVKEVIKNAIRTNDFMSNVIYGERLSLVVDCMSPEEIKENTVIMKQGDMGSFFCVSFEGSFEVIKDDVVVTVFGPGVVFGELAILYKAKRFASVRAITDSKLWRLDRNVLQKILREIATNEREDNLRFLKSVTIFEKYSLESLGKIADLLKRELYVSGAQIIRQGDAGDKFYIIRGGTVTVTKNTAKGEEKVAMLKKGSYFGEKALISEEKRMASIYANAPGTECLVLDKESFLTHINTVETKSIKRFSNAKGTTKYGHVKLEDLKIVGTLGVGGFGRVELVELEYSKGKTEVFALKYLKKIDMVQQQQQQHVFNEKNIMAKCNNNFIIQLYNTYKDTRYLYFLMEPCLGGDLWGLLQKHKCFDEKTSIFFAGCVVAAFEYLHERNIIYRDLKPENLMLDQKGYLKLIDFGFAKELKPGEKTWTFAGTPEYVAPEIILNKGHDKSVDYWALGIFIHELMCGRPPFRGKDHLKTYTLILRGVEATEMPSKISKHAKDIIRKLCRQIPTDRLGNQKSGIVDIQKHTWFTSNKLDWNKLKDQSWSAPLVRKINNNNKLSNFDECPRDYDDPQEENSGWDDDF